MFKSMQTSVNVRDEEAVPIWHALYALFLDINDMLF